MKRMVAKMQQYHIIPLDMYCTNVQLNTESTLIYIICVGCFDAKTIFLFYFIFFNTNKKGSVLL